MNIEQVVEIFKDATPGYFATTKGDQLEVRGWEFEFAEGNKFFFTTANTKYVYKQMKVNPQVAFAGAVGEHNVRISGKAKNVFPCAEMCKKISHGDASYGI